VLNLVGAEEKFIAQQFERHFLKVGIKAGIAGAGIAALAFQVLPYISGRMGTTSAAGAEVRRLAGAGTLDPGGYAVLVIVVAAVAAICKMTSRYGVRWILNQQDA
jgi:cell division transport system permease protein